MHLTVTQVIVLALRSISVMIPSEVCLWPLLITKFWCTILTLISSANVQVTLHNELIMSLYTIITISWGIALIFCWSCCFIYSNYTAFPTNFLRWSLHELLSHVCFHCTFVQWTLFPLFSSNLELSRIYVAHQETTWITLQPTSPEILFSHKQQE